MRQTAELQPWASGGQVFGLSKDLVARILWETALEVEVAQESWSILKDGLFQAQELSVLMWRRLRKCDRSLPGLYGELGWSSNAESEYTAGEGRDGLPGRKTCQSVQGHSKGS